METVTVEVEFLMGRVVATDACERNRAEWPPNPQRLFSGLVAMHSELALGEPGRAALMWLESLPPPEIRADVAPFVSSGAAVAHGGAGNAAARPRRRRAYRRQPVHA